MAFPGTTKNSNAKKPEFNTKFKDVLTTMQQLRKQTRKQGPYLNLDTGKKQCNATVVLQKETDGHSHEGVGYRGAHEDTQGDFIFLNTLYAGTLVYTDVLYGAF